MALKDSVKINEDLGEALPFVAALMQQSMDQNFTLMDSLYESACADRDKAIAEANDLRPDAMRWRRLAWSLHDTVAGEQWNP